MRRTTQRRTVATFLGMLTLGLAPGNVAQAPQPPCRHEELQKADFLGGTWRVTVSERTGEGHDGWRRREGASAWTWRVEGCALVEEISLEGDAVPYAGLTLLAYDHRDEEWALSTVDSLHGNIVSMAGRSVDDGLVFSGAQIRRGRVLLDRVAFRRDGENGFSLLIQSSFDAGESWMTMAESRYVKAEQE